MEPVVMSLSGGMDSSTLLALALHRGHPVLPVYFYYGSKHNEYENLAAQQVAAHFGLVARRIDLSGVMAGFRSALLKGGEEIPEGHYTDATMSKTVVPGRNIIFASILAGLAMSEGAKLVGLGVHAGDHAIYPDCRPDFIRYMDDAVSSGTGGQVSLWAPFILMDKYGILDLDKRLSLGTPYHLTRTCYKDQPLACGRCGSCRERLEAFEKLGVKDPVEYE